MAFKDFVKKYWGYILSALGMLAAFFCGRNHRDREEGLDFNNRVCEDLTGEITKVGEQLTDSREQLEDCREQLEARRSEIRELAEECSDVSDIIRKYEQGNKAAQNKK